MFLSILLLSQQLIYVPADQTEKDGYHTVVLNHPITLESATTEVSSTCNSSNIVKLRYSNDWLDGKRGQVNSVTLNGKEVPGLAPWLTEEAANRSIVLIAIRDCGWDEKKPEISAIMDLSQAGSVRDKKKPRFRFKFNATEFTSVE